jgi:hypothetical protein
MEFLIGSKTGLVGVKVQTENICPLRTPYISF